MRLRKMQLSCALISATLAADISLNVAEEISKNVGDTLLLSCDVTLDNDIVDDFDKNIWTTDVANKELTQFATVTPKNKKKLNSKLYMTLATSDSGSYTCASGDLTKTVKLTVLDKIAFVDSPNGAPIAKPIVLGLDNEVICQATPANLNYVWWTPDGKNVAGATLNTADFSSGSEGDYKCTVDNANGDATSLSQSSYAEVVYQITIVYAPKVTVSPTEELVITADTGSNTLTCTSDGKPAGDFKWSKNGVDIDGATNDTLVLDQLPYSDNGKLSYTCTSSNDYGSNSASVSARIIQPPNATISESVAGAKFAKTEPESMSLTCVGTGDPTPDQFVWTLPDGTTQEGATLSIDAVDETHHGLFQCEARSTYNDVTYGPASATIDVDVKYKPRFKSKETVYAVRGKDTTVMCAFKANPKPSVTWSESPDSIGNDTATGDFETSSSITLTSVTDFTATYTCSGRNEIDATEQVITLVEATKPAKPVKPNATNVGYRNVTLSWAKPASDIPITSYIVKYRQDGKGEPMVTTIEPAEGQTEPPTEVQITSLLSGQSYQFNITAENLAGKSEESESTPVDTKAPEKEKPVLDVQTNNTSGQIKWVVTTVGSETIKKLKIKYGKYDGKGNQIDERVKEINIETNTKSDQVDIESMSLEGGVKYWVELSVVNDQEMESDKQRTDFTMPDLIQKGSAGTVISVMVGIIFILILFVDISCYYMKQGGFIMTLQRAMCAGGDDKEEIEKGEKMPLNQDGSDSDKEKNRETDE